MPDPRIPEDSPPPRRRGGRKRGRRSAGSAAPSAPKSATPAAAEAVEAAAPPDLLPETSDVAPAAPEAVEPAPVEAANVEGEAAAGDTPEPVPVAAPVAEEEAVAGDMTEPAPVETAVAEEEVADLEGIEEGGTAATETDESSPSEVPAPDEVAPPDTLERGLATILGGPPLVGRPTWLDVPPERVGPLLAVFADEGARLLAMTVLPPPEPEDALPATLDLRYHFVVSATAITVSTHTPRRSAPSAAGLFPAMTWRERELAGEHGLRFVEPLMDLEEEPGVAARDQGSGIKDQESSSGEPRPDPPMPNPDP
jgi:hypothetical protein